MIQLRPLSSIDIYPFYKWLNDALVIKYSLSLFQKISTKQEIDEWYSELINNKEIVNYGIFLKSTSKLIGYAGLCNISNEKKSGEFYIFIGDRAMWGKGIATIVSKKLIKIGFEEINLEEIYLTVSKPNIGGIKAYKKAGFVFKDRLVDACYRDNAYHDKLIMTIKKKELTNE